MNFIEETRCKLSVNNSSFNTVNTYKVKASATSVRICCWVFSLHGCCSC